MNRNKTVIPSIWHRLGPGVLLAATSIGASHLVLSPQAGSLFGYSLLWLVLVCHVLKYPAFECGPRYSAATGKNLLHGYMKTRGPKGWAVYIFLISTILQGIGVLAGVVSVSGCTLWTWIGIWDTPTMSLVILAIVFILLVGGGFMWLDNINKVMMAILAVATFMAFLASPPPLGQSVKGLLLPSIPKGSIMLVAALLGWMPTGIDVSIWHSFWTLEKLKLLGMDDTSLPKKASRISTAVTDMRIGYGLSMLTGFMFLCLGAVHLGGRGAELKGVQFAKAISDAYSGILGRWMYHVFMLTAFFAMFSTSYTVLDGFSRSFSEAMAVLKPSWFDPPKTRRKVYLGFVIASSMFAAITLSLVGNPVRLVTAVAMISLAAAPILYGLNLTCITRDVEEDDMGPSRLTIVIGWLGIGMMLVAIAASIYVNFTG